MRFDFEVCFLRFLGFCDVMMKTLAIIIIIKFKKFKKEKEIKKENHHKLSFSLSNRTCCLTKH
jgi:hypothetical protein